MKKNLTPLLILTICGPAFPQTSQTSQTEKKLEAAVAAPEPAPDTVSASGQITLNFQEIEIRALLQVMADFTGLNMVVSDAVTGAVTLRMKDVPWRQALEIILSSRGLAQRQTGNVMQVATKAEMVARDKAELEAQQAMQVMEPTRLREFKLNYARAAEVSRSLSNSAASSSPGAGSSPGGFGSSSSTGLGSWGGAAMGSSRILSARGSVITDVRTNQIFVTDVPAALLRVEALILKLDIPVRQVLIEARIVEASDSFGRSIGVRLGGRPIATSGSQNIQLGSSYGTPDIPTAGTQALSGNLGATAGDFVNLPGVGQNGYPAATFALSLFNASLTRVLNLEISAMEADGKGKIISSPRIVTTDQVKALIEQGTELPYQEKTASGATSVAFRKANLKLEVTPQITPDGNIVLNLDVNKDSVGQTTLNGLAIDTKHVQTQVLVENGGTVVIGGIFEQTETNNETKVPFLGDLPGLGVLFRTRTRSLSKSEMLVFITPKLLPARGLISEPLPTLGSAAN